MKKTILNSFVGAVVFCLTCFLILYAVKARQTNNPNIADSNSSALYVTNNETLSAVKRNSLADKVLSADILRLDCVKESPTKGRAYNCSWTDVWSSWVSDLVVINCPTWYYSVWWWGQVNGSQRIRQTNTWRQNGWYFSSADGIEEVEVICIKLK